jgi:hypothetical protein
MTLREAMRTAAWHYVVPGEIIQEVFGAQTASPSKFPLIGALIRLFVNKYRIVAVTEQRILILNSGRFGMRKACGVVESLPRATVLGPGTGNWHAISTPSGTLRVRRRFFAEIEAADQLARAGLY